MSTAILEATAELSTAGHAKHYKNTLRHTWVCAVSDCDGVHHYYVAA